MVSFAHRLAALVAFFLLTAGCSGGSDGGPTSPTEPGPTNAVTYAVLGASDGIGFGSSVPCAVFDLGCENGTGYAQAIRRRFQAEGRTVTFNNLSWPGAVLSRSIAGLAMSLGRSDPGAFIDRYPPFVAAATTHVTIFVGGNDANIIGSAISAGAAGGDIRGFIDGQVRQWGDDLVELVSRVRGRAPNARIVAYNLPNLAAAPYMAGRSVQERSIMQRIATGLTDQVNLLTTRNVAVVDMMCDGRVLQPSSFSGDGFHPSDAGYAVMAELGYAALTGTSFTPQPSCPQRTLLPVF